MYNLQATLREITVEVMAVTEITVEVVDVPMFLDLSPSLFPDMLPNDLDMSDLEVDDQLPPPPEVVYLDLDFEIDPFPDLSPAQLGLHPTHL